MTLLGVHLTILIGPTVPTPIPPMMIEALESVEVTHDDGGRSGFQIVFNAERGGPLGLMDYPLLNTSLLRPFNRVILVVAFNASPKVLMDGMITHQQLTASSEPGQSILTVTGEDLSVMMDLEEKVVEHIGQPESAIAMKLIGNYTEYGLIPMVIPPPSFDLPLPMERTPVQIGTDLEYLQEMAARFAYVFYISPGPLPLFSTAYWGPPERVSAPQKALSVNMGPLTNVESLDFQHDALSPTTVSGTVQDRLTNESLPLETFASTRPPLVLEPTLSPLTETRTSLPKARSGLTYPQAFARAQAQTDSSTDEVVTAMGELDALQYGEALQARGVVGVRGVGLSYDGNYYVKRVTHLISKGEYRQRFTLTREGMGPLLPVVRP